MTRREWLAMTSAAPFGARAGGGEEHAERRPGAVTTCAGVWLARRGRMAARALTPIARLARSQREVDTEWREDGADERGSESRERNRATSPNP
jgi:hypothetical protein